MTTSQCSNTSSDGSLVSLQSVDSALGRSYTGRQKAAMLIAAFMLNAIAFGTDLASGILYAKLLDPPCAANRSENATMANVYDNGPGQFVLMDTSTLSVDTPVTPLMIDVGSGEANVSVVNASLTLNETLEGDEVMSCGGLGRSAAETGEGRCFVSSIFFLFFELVWPFTLTRSEYHGPGRHRRGPRPAALELLCNPHVHTST